MHSDHDPHLDSVNSRLGTTLLVGGIVGLLMCMAALSDALPAALLRLWTRAPMFWWLLTAGAFVAGMMLLWKSGHAETDWQPRRGGKRFQSGVLYTRKDCGLCDDARAVLHLYRRWLPPIREIDIDIHPDFRDAFQTCVPVLELDDEIRFRGRVNEVLLRRLIQGGAPSQDVQQSAGTE
jgi:hypothetical protein